MSLLVPLPLEGGCPPKKIFRQIFSIFSLFNFFFSNFFFILNFFFKFFFSNFFFFKLFGHDQAGARAVRLLQSRRRTVLFILLTVMYPIVYSLTEKMARSHGSIITHCKIGKLAGKKIKEMSVLKNNKPHFVRNIRSMFNV